MLPIMTLPDWMLLACAALWIITLTLFLVYRLSKKRAMRRRDLMPTFQQPSWPGQSGFDTMIHHEAISQQIDTVFNALAAVIETERIKLKALAGCHPIGEEKISPSIQTAAALSASGNSGSHQLLDIGRKVTELSEQGYPQGEIARQLGLSRSEVVLAARMKSSPKQELRALRLNAVA